MAKQMNISADMYIDGNITANNLLYSDSASGSTGDITINGVEFKTQDNSFGYVDSQGFHPFKGITTGEAWLMMGLNGFKLFHNNPTGGYTGEVAFHWVDFSNIQSFSYSIPAMDSITGITFYDAHTGAIVNQDMEAGSATKPAKTGSIDCSNWPDRVHIGMRCSFNQDFIVYITGYTKKY